MSRSFCIKRRLKSASEQKKTKTSKKRFVAKRASALAKNGSAEVPVRNTGGQECPPYQRILEVEHNHDEARKISGICESGARLVLLGVGRRHRDEPGRLAGHHEDRTRQRDEGR